MMWVIPDTNNPDNFQDLEDVTAIASRATVQYTETNKTFITLSLRNISTNDKQTLLCLAEYVISDDPKQTWGDGTVFQVSEHQHGMCT